MSLLTGSNPFYLSEGWRDRDYWAVTDARDPFEGMDTEDYMNYHEAGERVNKEMLKKTLQHSKLTDEHWNSVYGLHGAIQKHSDAYEEHENDGDDGFEMSREAHAHDNSDHDEDHSMHASDYHTDTSHEHAYMGSVHKEAGNRAAWKAHQKAAALHKLASSDPETHRDAAHSASTAANKHDGNM